MEKRISKGVFVAAVKTFQQKIDHKCWEEYGISDDDCAVGLLAALESIGYELMEDVYLADLHPEDVEYRRKSLESPWPQYREQIQKNLDLYFTTVVVRANGKSS